MKLLKLSRPERYTLEDYMQDFRDEMESLFRRSFEPFREHEEELEGGKMVHTPPIEICDKDGNLEIKAQLPGIKKEDINVEITDDLIKINAETKQEYKEEQDNVYRSEFRYGKYVRNISLPEEVVSSEAQAEFTDGVLHISAPKVKKEQKEVKKLTIK